MILGLVKCAQFVSATFIINYNFFRSCSVVHLVALVVVVVVGVGVVVVVVVVVGGGGRGVVVVVMVVGVVVRQV